MDAIDPTNPDLADLFRHATTFTFRVVPDRHPIRDRFGGLDVHCVTVEWRDLGAGWVIGDGIHHVWSRETNGFVPDHGTESAFLEATRFSLLDAYRIAKVQIVSKLGELEIDWDARGLTRPRRPSSP